MEFTCPHPLGRPLRRAQFPFARVPYPLPLPCCSSPRQGILGVTFARYLVSGLHKHAVPASDVSVLVKMVAIGTVSALTATNCAFLRMGSTLQNVLTVLKMVLLLLLVCGTAARPPSLPPPRRDTIKRIS